LAGNKHKLMGQGGSQMQDRYPQQYRVLRQLQADLVQVKGWQHIETCENADLGLCYLFGWVGSSSTEGEIPQIVVPCTTHEPLSMARYGKPILLSCTGLAVVLNAGVQDDKSTGPPR
jgi:hypothetical protein